MGLLKVNRSRPAADSSFRLPYTALYSIMEIGMDVIEKAFEEAPSYEKKLQEAREKHLGT